MSAQASRKNISMQDITMGRLYWRDVGLVFVPLYNFFHGLGLPRKGV